MKRIIAIILTASILLCAAACGTQDSAGQKQQDTTEQTGISENGTAKTAEQEYLEKAVAQMNFSGVIRLSENGDKICGIAQGEGISSDTRFCIGSVSKQFTAAAVMKLCEEGKLRLDDRLDKFFPSYTAGKRLTIKNLLSMRSGITEFYDVTYIDNAFTELPAGELRKTVTNGNTAAQNQKLLENWLFKQPLSFEPDSLYTYSNSNYFLLARVIEIVTNERFNDYITKSFFKPLGMKNSCFIDDVDLKSLKDLAPPTVNPRTVYVGVTMGLGDIISNADDLDLWLTSLREHRLISEKSVNEMMTDHSPEDEYAYGYGLIPDGRGGAFHYGYITTYQAMVYLNPETGLNAFAVTNDDAHINGNLAEVFHTAISKRLAK